MTQLHVHWFFFLPQRWQDEGKSTFFPLRLLLSVLPHLSNGIADFPPLENPVHYFGSLFFPLPNFFRFFFASSKRFGPRTFIPYFPCV